MPMLISRDTNEERDFDESTEPQKNLCRFDVRIKKRKYFFFLHKKVYR